MFQKVGLLDILLGLWNRKKQIILVGCLAIITAVAVTAVSVSDFDAGGKNETYYKSVIYYIDTTEKTEGVDLVSQAQKVRATYLTLYDTELFAQYLQTFVGEQADIALSEYLIPVKAASDVKITIPDTNILDIYRSVTVSGPSNASTIMISLECTDSRIGDQVLDACYQYAVEKLQSKIPSSTITEIGRTDYVEPGSEGKTLTLMDVAKRSIKNAVVYGIVFEFVYLLIAVFVIIFKPVVNRENDIREYGDIAVLTGSPAKSKASISAESVYSAKYIAGHMEGQFLGFVGADRRCDTQKNTNICSIYHALCKMGKKTLLVNFDPAFTADFDYVDAKISTDDVMYDYASALKNVSAESYELILVNFCSASEKGYLLSTQMPVRDMVLEVNFGKTTYRTVEKSMDILKQNNLNLFAVLAAK